MDVSGNALFNQEESPVKRLFGFSVLAALFFGVASSHLVFAKPPQATKTLLCHITGESEDGTTWTGRVIEIAMAAVPAHCSHGDHSPGLLLEKGDDCSRPKTLDGGPDPNAGNCGDELVEPNLDDD